jgi:regulator of replication initiation timing
VQRLTEHAAELETKLNSALSYNENITAKVEVLDAQNLQLRLENSKLKKENAELKRKVEVLEQRK